MLRNTEKYTLTYTEIPTEAQVEMEDDLYLDGFGRLQRLLWWDPHFSVSEQLLDEKSDVPPCDGDVFYTAADHVALSLWQISQPIIEYRGSSAHPISFRSVCFSPQGWRG